jgi:hypothetical protein
MDGTCDMPVVAPPTLTEDMETELSGNLGDNEPEAGGAE